METAAMMPASGAQGGAATLSLSAFDAAVKRAFRGSRAVDADRWAVDHQAGDLEEHLRPGMRGIGGGVILWCDLHHVAADEIDALQAAQNRLRLARGEAANLWRAGARREGRVEAVDIEGQVGRPV